MKIAELFAEIKSEITGNLYLDDTIASLAVAPVERVRLWLEVRQDESRMNVADMKAYINILSCLGISSKRGYPRKVYEFGTLNKGATVYQGDDCCYVGPVMDMMMRWVSDRLKEGDDDAYTYQVALDNAQWKEIETEFSSRYGCSLKDRGLSPRGGARVVEMAVDGAPGITVEIGAICIGTLGAYEDMKTVEWATCYAVESLPESFHVMKCYPNRTGTDFHY